MDILWMDGKPCDICGQSYPGKNDSARYNELLTIIWVVFTCLHYLVCKGFYPNNWRGYHCICSSLSEPQFIFIPSKKKNLHLIARLKIPAAQIRVGFASYQSWSINTPENTRFYFSGFSDRQLAWFKSWAFSLWIFH